MTRRELRENTFCILYQNDFYLPEEIDHQIDLFLEREELITKNDKDKMEIKIRAKSIILKIEELDKKIEAASEGWKVHRMGKVELAIIRLALYEILYDEQIPESVAINEAVEIAKKFGGDDAPSFVNGILAKLV